MIGFLKGTIQSKNANSLIIDVHGVGYQVFAPLFLIQELKLDNPIALFIYTHVREDELSLFGFSSQEEKQIFLHLISVSGIGPKLSLNILSAANGAKNIIKAIQNAQVDFFENIKGVGKKSAQRIIVDLKSKIGGLKELEFEAEADRDLVEALKGLGFSHEEIKKSILNVNKNLEHKRIKKDLSLEEKIKLALKEK
jgi:Holliday junction DNA helicase RuvA